MVTVVLVCGTPDFTLMKDHNSSSLLKSMLSGVSRLSMTGAQGTRPEIVSAELGRSGGCLKDFLIEILSNNKDSHYDIKITLYKSMKTIVQYKNRDN